MVCPPVPILLCDGVSPHPCVMGDSCLCFQFSYFDPAKVKSTPQLRTDLFSRKLAQVLVTDFFGSVRNIELLNETSPGDYQSEVEEEREGEEEEGRMLPEKDTSLQGGRYLTPQDSLVSRQQPIPLKLLQCL